MRTRPHITLDDRWREYLNSINADGHHLWVTVSLAGASLSLARTAGRASRRGGLLVRVRYDEDRDEIELLTRGQRDGDSARYFLPAPRAVAVEERDGGKLIRVQDASGTCTEIALTLLPSDELERAVASEWPSP
jgi:hypothetical protein